ncbi:ATP-binding cassette domain-containing protein [Microvirga tunisiensis]|uniref:ATP-binding cassette domain-containing protein n=1 Tax=Pannonibacter tanglangensis TaxID=2750084 RepID=A0A7X5F3D9_9HYPH|nr:ABC transporter ATP-binding protein [Pannonibacter sp. XCT-53]NBN78739.1 ATP-binding cassette domain-containing protein [Pannonibacter sp. XCT-53]
MTATPLLSIRNLTKVFDTPGGKVRALTDVSLDIPRGSILGLVGESGSGKTTLGRCVLRLIEPTSGQVVFDGTDITALGARDMKAMRKRMQIVFQDPFSSLNPRMRVHEIIGEALIAHGIGKTGRERRDRAAALLEEVGLRPDQLDRFPHEFSGGQRQRIGIARALAVDPDFIVADESVSALDVSVQAQILNLLNDLRQKRGLTMLFIAHDLSVVEYLCEDVAVLYLGRVMEAGDCRSIYAAPSHPYTRALLAAAPVPDPDAPRAGVMLTGDIPSPLNPPSGCVFHTRCPVVMEDCRQLLPTPQPARSSVTAACHRLNETVSC